MPGISMEDLRKQMKRDADKLVHRAKEWHRLKPDHWGYPTGLPQLDDLTGGLPPDEIIVLAGGPGSGKTSFAMQALIHASEWTVKHPEQTPTDTWHVFVSAEMSRAAVMQRTACSRIAVSLTDLRRGQVTDEQLDAYEAELAYLCSLPLLVVDSAEPLTSEDVVMLSSALLGEGLTIGVLAIDYLQELADEGANEFARINGALKKIKYVKQQTGGSLLVLSQYSRGKLKEKREPTMEDLLGSGNIERSADQVWAIHDPESTFAEVAPGVVSKEVFVLKNRNGKRGKVTLDFYEAQTMFADPADVSVEDMELVDGLYRRRPHGPLSHATSSGRVVDADAPNPQYPQYPQNPTSLRVIR